MNAFEGSESTRDIELDYDEVTSLISSKRGHILFQLCGFQSAW